MTLHEISNQIYDLTIDGFVNGERFTRRELEQAIRRWMRNPERNKIPNTCVIEVCLMDGRWLATIDRFADRPDGYDYTIPDNREQEARIYQKLTE